MDRRRFVVVAYEAAELLDIACVTSTLESANWHGALPYYEYRVATPGDAPSPPAPRCASTRSSRSNASRVRSTRC
ncbi:hypothetical protein ACFMQL_19705 [Nonomuraea fastidiosa]|uniref:hypothetical protein n=1 Tax=Nonomuraea TaxID=83681 RepID=UPI00325107C9